MRSLVARHRRAGSEQPRLGAGASHPPSCLVVPFWPETGFQRGTHSPKMGFGRGYAGFGAADDQLRRCHAPRPVRAGEPEPPVAE